MKPIAIRPARIREPRLRASVVLASNILGSSRSQSATNLTMSTFGNAAWIAETNITHDGIAAAQSGSVSNSMSSGLQTTVAGPGVLTFWWKVSSEEFFDVLSFSVDPETNLEASISGEVDWEPQTFFIGPGSQTLSWIYAKDPDVSVGLDAGWVDQVTFVPVIPAQLSAPTLLPDGSLLFNAFTTNGSILPLSDASDLQFEGSSNLVDWTQLTNGVTITNGSAQLRDPSASNSTTRFYRLAPR